MTTVSLPDEITALRAEVTKLRLELTEAYELQAILEEENHRIRETFKTTIDEVTVLCQDILEGLK
jgi:hypothetical protein